MKKTPQFLRGLFQYSLIIRELQKSPLDFQDSFSTFEKMFV